MSEVAPSKLARALERHFGTDPALHGDLYQLICSRALVGDMLAGRHRADLCEATLLAAYCKVSIFEFLEDVHD